MTHHKKILLTLLCGFLALTVRAQCPDFMDLYSNQVTGTRGNFFDSLMVVGIVEGRHTLITQQGTDPRTGDQLPLIPDGDSMVVKLGNEQIGAETESLIYTFTVDPDYSVLLLKYAVVLEDPGHDEIEQPRFLIQMLDVNDELISDCMEYNVISSPTIPGFQEYNMSTGVVMWRPWTLNGFDLSAYAGQTVKLRLSTYDCSLGAHYGYAYFTAKCVDKHLSFTGCDGEQVTISVMEGFESYVWNNGDTIPTATYTIQGNTNATCVITTVTGCQIVQSVIFGQDTLMEDHIYYDTVCEGMGYNNHDFNLAPMPAPGEYTFQNTFYDVVNCEEGATSTLYLYVPPRYLHLYDVSCEGLNYDANGFHFDQLAPGEITDSFSVTLPCGCEFTTILHLTVNPVTQIPQVINGPNVVCGGSLEAYSLENGPLPPSAYYHWTVPAGVTVYHGQGTPNVQIYFMPSTPSPAQCTLFVNNGCYDVAIPFDVAIDSAYTYIFSDTVCIGNPYTQNGFQLGVQDSVGFFVHIVHDTTQLGCDSVSILQLCVAEIPLVIALADPTVLCVGSETELHAVGSQASVNLTSDFPTVGVGDILCTDGTTVHPEDWPCNKVALGVVFYVDTTGDHGWAVSLQDEPTPYIWGLLLSLDIPDLMNCPNAFSTMEDLDGYHNTATIRATGTAAQYPAAYQVDFEQGWYLPAAAQLYRIYATLGIVNSSLQAVGGAVFPMDSNWSYWSSSEKTPYEAWALYNSTSLTSVNKSVSLPVRTIRNF